MVYLALVARYIGVICLILSLITFLPFAYATGFAHNTNWGTFGNLLATAGILFVYRYLSGCFRASSIKGFAWSIGLSFASSIALIYLGVHHADKNASASFFIYLLPTIIAAIYGIWAGKFTSDYLEDSFEISGEGVLNSIVDNGFRNTWNGISDFYEDCLYASTSQGVLVYANTSFLLSLIIMMIYY